MNSTEERVEEITKDLQITGDLVALSESKGGQQLVEGLTIDIVSSIESLINQREKLTLQEFVAIACDLKTRIDVVRSIKRAKGNKKFLEELLAEALK